MAAGFLHRERVRKIRERINKTESVIFLEPHLGCNIFFFYCVAFMKRNCRDQPTLKGEVFHEDVNTRKGESLIAILESIYHWKLGDNSPNRGRLLSTYYVLGTI